MGSEGSSSKSSFKMNLTCFFTVSLGNHSSIGSCRGWECPLVHVGGTTSPCPASGFQWLGVQVKITQGVAELLISMVRLGRAGKGRGVPVWSVGEDVNTQMLGQGTLASLWLFPTPGMVMLPS